MRLNVILLHRYSSLKKNERWGLKEYLHVVMKWTRKITFWLFFSRAVDISISVRMNLSSTSHQFASFRHHIWAIQRNLDASWLSFYILCNRLSKLHNVAKFKWCSYDNSIGVIFKIIMHELFFSNFRWKMRYFKFLSYYSELLLIELRF
jgi:hypothetical protein